MVISAGKKPVRLYELPGEFPAAAGGGISLEYQTPGTIYEQIADNIELAILDGEHSEDSRIVSVRKAASQMGVNVNMVVRSYNLLEERDGLCKERGLVYFVARGAEAHTLQRRRQEFFANTLPQLLHTMRRLKINAADVERTLHNRG